MVWSTCGCSEDRKATNLTRIPMRIALVAALTLAFTQHSTAAEPSAVSSDGSHADAAAPPVRFQVPFPFVALQGVDLESISTSPPDLRIARTLGDASPACEGDSLPPHPSVKATDRLVAVDAIPISLMTFQQVIDMPVGSIVVLPLFKAASTATHGNILTGFARVEIMRPQYVEFESTTAERLEEIQEWQAAVARREQEQLQREQEERERKAAAENDAVEKEAREKREKEEQYRLEMTPHEMVHTKRGVGKEFRYEVLFTTNGPIGLNWDLLTTDKTVVSYVEPKLAAERAGVIAHKDQLIELNDVETSGMSPQEVVQVYIQSTPPRRMVFCVATTAAVALKQSAVALDQHAGKVQNWTIVFDSPPILQQWSPRLHLATWSTEPTELVNQTFRLAAASPITACQPLASADGTVAYLAYRGGCSFVDKANAALKGSTKALIVVNNLKGLGRFPAKMQDVDEVPIPVAMMGKLDGEITMSVLAYDRDVRFHLQQEDPSVALAWELPPSPPPKLSNQELTLRRDPKKSARTLTLWFVNSTASTAKQETAEFRVLPALFGSNITEMPYRVVMAYPQETACHPQGLGVLGTRSVIVVKRGGCSFGVKAQSVQTVGGAGMLMVNSDESLLPLMSDPREVASITIWAASIGATNGSFIQALLERNKNLPMLVKIAPLTAPTGQ